MKFRSLLSADVLWTEALIVSVFSDAPALANEPANLMTPTNVADGARSLAAAGGLALALGAAGAQS